MKYIRNSLTIDALQKSDDPWSFLLGSRRVFILKEVRRWRGWRGLLAVIIQIIGGGWWRGGGLVEVPVLLVVRLALSGVNRNFPDVVIVSVTTVTPP